MVRICSCSLVALTSLLLWVSSAPAQVYVRAPFVSVWVGPPGSPGGVYVRAPFVSVHVDRRPPMVVMPAQPPAQAPVPANPDDGTLLPPPRLLTPGTAPQDGSVRVPSVEEFAASFRPVPGSYEVAMIHPLTGTPVTVQFTLPPGRTPKISVHRRELEFDYGERDVSIRFQRGGKVKVSYDD
jgi:hypothetical protein